MSKIKKICEKQIELLETLSSGGNLLDNDQINNLEKLKNLLRELG